MSLTQTQSRTQTESDERSRGPRKFEIWLKNESKRQQPDKEGDSIVRNGQGRNPKVTMLSDLPPSRAAERNHESYVQDNETPAQTDKSWRNATDRYQTSSTNFRPLGNDNLSAETAHWGSHRRRSSKDNTERRDAIQDHSLPYDSRHTFSTHIIPDRYIPSDVEKRLSDCKREKKSIAESLSQTKEKLRVADTRNEELETQVKSLTEELGEIKDRLREAENRRRKTARLLKETASELHGANQFITKTEAMSEMDVVNMVDDLNAEIMQTSASIADALGELSRRKEPESTVNADERDFNQRALGNALIRYLESEEPSINPMSVQLALQFCLAETCYVVIESWRPGKWIGEDFLFEIYASMKRTGQFSLARGHKDIIFNLTLQKFNR
ncbi:hypothetical protein C0992_004804 [Termitomyces sp. T32_za158]|nr:hypothetical protein C0992_004804 [Termitomyces sp. T32_za158]